MNNTTFENAKILIVDDRQANIDVLTGLLDIKGFTNYTSTTDSRNVKDLYEKIKPDLILLDLHMPYLDGFQVLLQLKSLIPSETFLPILVLTADISPEAKQEALNGGASDFITKPFDLIEVYIRINNLLRILSLHQQLENHNLILE
ncbi:MAG: response regulator [Ignavibacteriaceae bacterium]|nr:response regulator [Ignavibacteriaceae bacterium]